MPDRPTAPRFAPAAVVAEHRDDGSILLRSPAPLGPFARCVGDLLRHWAEFAPDRVFLAERAADGWRRTAGGGVSRENCRACSDFPPRRLVSRRTSSR